MNAEEQYRVGYFGDVRRERAGATLLERVVATGSLVLREIGGDRAGELSANRFLGSARVRIARSGREGNVAALIFAPSPLAGYGIHEFDSVLGAD